MLLFMSIVLNIAAITNLVSVRAPLGVSLSDFSDDHHLPVAHSNSYIVILMVNPTVRQTRQIGVMIQ